MLAMRVGRAGLLVIASSGSVLLQGPRAGPHMVSLPFHSWNADFLVPKLQTQLLGVALHTAWQ